MRERIYSTVSDLTIKNLKIGNYDNLIDCSQIINFAKQHQITGYLWDQEKFHIKFGRIRPKLSVIYGMGDRSLLDRPILGIVGPREPSSYGLDVTSDLIQGCVGSNIVTISGGADGIDECVHKQSIIHHIPTIVVLGGGLGWFLQSSHRSRFLQQVVEKGGLILSEFKLFAKPEKYTFPQRNRIIAGLSDHLFIPEAGLKSGSLITAHDAVKAGIPVRTVPHSIYSRTSLGTNNLIQSGFAKHIYHLQDWLSQSFCIDGVVTTNKEVVLTIEQQKIVSLLQQEGTLSFVDLHQKTQTDVQNLLGEISILEMEGVIMIDLHGFISINN